MTRLTTLLSLTALAALAMARRGSCRQRRAAHRDARAVGQPVDGGPRQGRRRRSRTKTASRVTMKYFEGGQQGDERDFVRKIKLGQLDGAAVTAIGLAMIDESIRVLELPMMFDSAEEMDYVADKMWPYFQKKFEKKGFKLNDRGEVGWIYFLSKNKVESLADLKGQKLWMWGDDQLVGAMFKKLGVNGVPLGVPEVDAGLTSGKINACYGSPVAAVALQWYSKVKYMTSMPMSFAIGATVISLDALKKISARGPEDPSRTSARRTPRSSAR